MTKRKARKKAKRTRKKMRPGGGKDKGTAFERKLCKDLSLWLTKGKRDDVLWRSSISGGRATTHGKKGKIMPHVAGDFCAVHPEGEEFVRQFYCEAKFYRDLKVAQFIFTGSGLLADFWKDTVKKAELFGKRPLLLFKQNQYPPMIGMSEMLIGQPRVTIARVQSNPIMYVYLLQDLFESPSAKWLVKVCAPRWVEKPKFIRPRLP